jgi:nucleoside-diphosphate-sugar epimerase
MRVLVTGASGFLGQALCGALLIHGIRVVGMVRRADAFLPEGTDRWVTPEMPDTAEDAPQRLSAVDTVVHTAGRAHVLNESLLDPLIMFRRINVDGTLSLARAAAAAGVRRFIFVSSIGVNGSQSGTEAFRDDDQPRPHSHYAQSKWEAEQGLRYIQAETGMAVLCVRPPMIYGRSAPGNFSLLSSLVGRNWPLPLGALRAPRSFVALDNIVDLLLCMVRHPAPPSGVYLAADGQTTTTSDFIRAMALGMGYKAKLIPVPVALLQALASLAGRGDQLRKMAVPLAVDISATTARLNWTPPVTMATAMKEAFADSGVVESSLEAPS